MHTRKQPKVSQRLNQKLHLRGKNHRLTVLKRLTSIQAKNGVFIA